MLDLNDARTVAERHLDRLRQLGEDVVLDEQHTVERPACFAFVYNSRDFVDRETGELHERNSAHSVEHHVREYEQARRVP